MIKSYSVKVRYAQDLKYASTINEAFDLIKHIDPKLCSLRRERSVFEQKQFSSSRSDINELRYHYIDQYDHTNVRMLLFADCWINHDHLSVLAKRSLLTVNQEQCIRKYWNMLLPFMHLATADIIEWLIDNLHEEEMDKAIFLNSDWTIGDLRKQNIKLLYKYQKHLSNPNHWINAKHNINSFQAGECEWLNSYYDVIANPIPKEKPIYGYKTFCINQSNQMSCRNYVFNSNIDHHIDFAYMCHSGFHFCKRKKDLINYYKDLHDTRNYAVYRVMAWGSVYTYGDKSVTTDLRILHKVNTPPKKLL